MKIKRPPGPKGVFLLGSALEFAKDPPAFLESNRKNYGDIVYFRLGKKQTYQLNKPEFIKHVLQDNNRNYIKSVDYDHLRLVIGNGLVTSEGEFWMKQRRITQPTFHKKQISLLAQTMTDITARMLVKWEHESHVNVAVEMMKLTLKIVGKTLLSTDFSEEAGELGPSISYLIEFVNGRIISPFNLPVSIPTSRNRKFQKALKLLDKVIFEIIASHRKNPEKYNDLLTMLMQASDEDTGEKMNDRQLRDEAMTIFLAGHETTANALTWLFYLLSQNKNEEIKVAEEVKSVLQDKVPTAEDTRNLHYTTHAIEETMRLYPPAWIIGRKALGNDQFGSYDVPAGSDIMICNYILHRSSELWKDSEKFMPSRFNPEEDKLRPRYHYFPFGGGQRICIGNNFAMMEMILIASMVIQKFRLSLAEGQVVERDHLVTLRPKYGMNMKIKLY